MISLNEITTLIHMDTVAACQKQKRKDIKNTREQFLPLFISQYNDHREQEQECDVQHIPAHSFFNNHVFLAYAHTELHIILKNNGVKCKLEF